MSKNSDKKGKAFEYILSDALKHKLTLCKYTVNLSHDYISCQNVDLQKFNLLSPYEQQYFSTNSELIANWFMGLLSNSKDNPITLNRLSDSKGVAGNPTDIEIISPNSQLNISAKHNNFSIKHQRLPNLYNQIGIDKGSIDEKIYRANLKKISNQFYEYSIAVNSTFTTFSDVKNADSNSINKELYEPSLDLYCRTLSNYSNSPTHVQNFFYFLIGKIDFYHVKMSEKGVVIKNYTALKIPTTFHIKKTNQSNQEIAFDNGFTFNLRIHTASSRFADCSKNCCSMKIDSTISRQPHVPEFIL